MIRTKEMREPAMMAQHHVAMDKMGGEDAMFDETSADNENQVRKSVLALFRNVANLYLIWLIFDIERQ